MVTFVESLANLGSHIMPEAEAESDQDQAAEEQVLAWVYEYAVKFNYSQLITRIENLCEVQGITSFPSSARFAYYLRRLKRISNFSITENVNQMQLLTEELLKLQQYQENVEIYNQIILLNIASRLLLLNDQELNHAILQKRLPVLNWDDRKQEYNLNDKYKKRFETCISWARECINKCLPSKEKSFQLSKFVLSDCKIQLESAQRRLTELLHEVFPDTAVEKISCSQEICEQLAQQEIRAYSDLMKVVEKEITEFSLINFLEMLFEYRLSKIFTHNVTRSPIENVQATSRNSVTVEEEARPLEFPVVFQSENEDVILINGKFRYIKSKQWYPVLFSGSTSDKDIEVFEEIVQFKELSKIHDTPDLNSMDFVWVNDKQVKVKSKHWHPATFCGPSLEKRILESSETGCLRVRVHERGVASGKLGCIKLPKKGKENGVDSCTSLPSSGNVFVMLKEGKSPEFPATLKYVDKVCINDKMREVKSKRWQPVLFSGSAVSIDSCGTDKVVQEEGSSGISERLKSNKFDCVWMNDNLVLVKNKPWHPVCSCNSIDEEGHSSSCDQTHPVLHPSRMMVCEQRPTAENFVIDNVARNKKQTKTVIKKRKTLPSSLPKTADASCSKLEAAVNRACCSLKSSKERDLVRLIKELESMVKILKLKLVNIRKQGKRTLGHSTLCHHETLTSDMVNPVKSGESESIVGKPGLGTASSCSNIDSIKATISSMLTINEGNSKDTNESERKPDKIGDTERNPCKPNVQKTSNETSVIDISDSDTTFYSALDDAGTKKTITNRKTKTKRMCSKNKEQKAERTRRTRGIIDSRDEYCTALSSNADETYHTALPSNADETYHTTFEYCNKLQYDAMIKPCYIPLKRICLTRKEIPGKKRKTKGRKGKKRNIK